MRLILLNLALLGAVTYQVATPTAPIPAPAARPPLNSDTSTTPSREAAPRRDYAVVSERPIFFADRRIPAPDLTVDAEADAEVMSEETMPEERTPPMDVQLLGTVITGAVTLALLEPVGGKPQRVAVGDLVAGWTIEDIQPELVRLSGADGERQLKIERSSSRSEAKPVTRTYGNRGQFRPVAGGATAQPVSAGREGRSLPTPGRSAPEQALVDAAGRQAAGGGVVGQGRASAADTATGAGENAGSGSNDSTAPGAPTPVGPPGIEGATPPANNIITPVVPVGGGGFNASSVEIDANGAIVNRSMAEYIEGYEGPNAQQD